MSAYADATHHVTLDSSGSPREEGRFEGGVLR